MTMTEFCKAFIVMHVI